MSLEVTPLEKMLQHAGPLREDGSDRFYGFENVRTDCRIRQPFPSSSSSIFLFSPQPNDRPLCLDKR